MPFRVSERTLARLEWPQLVARLARHAVTPHAHRILAEAPASLFEEDLTELRLRLAEAGEARLLCEAGELPPLGGVREIGAGLARLRRGGALSAPELLALGETLACLGATAAFLRRRAGESPALASLGAGLSDQGELASAIAAAIDDAGEVRDAASPELAAARAEARALGASLQERIARLLRDPELRATLQDAYFTLRGDRYVLPVRAEARSRVPGIVHDASASGTTVFVEPQALVELNNRMKQAELTAQREVRRVLAQLSARAASRADEIEADLARLARVDLALARGALALEMQAFLPEVGEEAEFALPGLRHPLLPMESAVPADVTLGREYTVLVISGPNAGGKTVALKAVGLAALMARAGLHVAAGPGARVGAVTQVLADIGDEQSIRESLSTFSAHMANLAAIVDAADGRSLVLLDEVGVGTDPSEGASLAQAILEALADAGARVVATTHYNLLKEMAAVDARFENASVEFDRETWAPTYRLRMGTAGSSSATAVAARMGMRAGVIERANALLDREDRSLDRMLVELSASRAALEREQREATRLRKESEAARDAYRQRLERLHAQRDRLLASLRRDLERAFREAHEEVAEVIRTLQRGGGGARDAARARERLQSLAREASQRSQSGEAALPERPRPRVDWRQRAPGDPVGLPGGRQGRLLSLPDRRGRVSVQVGGATLQLPADQVTPPEATPEQRTPREARITWETQPAAAPAALDLRGLRVDEALARVDEALDDAAGAGRARLEIVHGIGTGALGRAVREHLGHSPYVVRLEAGDPERGGNGVTVAHLQA